MTGAEQARAHTSQNLETHRESIRTNSAREKVELARGQTLNSRPQVTGIDFYSLRAAIQTECHIVWNC